MDDQKKQIWTNPQNQASQEKAEPPIGSSQPLQNSNPQTPVPTQFEWTENPLSKPRSIPENQPAKLQEKDLSFKPEELKQVGQIVPIQPPTPAQNTQPSAPAEAKIIAHDFVVPTIQSPLLATGTHTQNEQLFVQSKSKLPIFILLAVLILGAVLGGGYFSYQKFFKAPNSIPEEINFQRKSNAINRVISGYGQEEPSIVKIEEEVEFEKYLDQNKKFAIEKPKNWSVSPTDKKTTISKSEPDKDSLGFQYTPKVEISFLLGKDYNAALAEVKSELLDNPKNQMVTEIEITGTGFPGHNFEAIIYDGENPIHVSKLVILYKEQLYLISSFSLAENWDSYRNLFNNIMTSFVPGE